MTTNPPEWFGKALHKARVGDAENAARLILSFVGDDPDREGLKETPHRMVRAWQEMLSGYHEEGTIPALMKTFEKETYDQMIVVPDIEFVSWCEHHFLPFQGVAHVGYIPGAKIVGLSKLARVVDVFAKRLQVQERLTTQIASTIQKYLEPVGAGCVIEARHSCMSCRGVRKQRSRMVTSHLVGAIKDEPETRSEFFNLIRGKR